MNVLLINGSPNKNGCTYTALSEVAGQLNKQGIETNIFHIGNKLEDASTVVNVPKVDIVLSKTIW